jgi:photosystem II stability/assembly factor-like uncharacterized protein
MFVAIASTTTAALADPAIAPDAYGELRWRAIGPFRGGRTRAVAGIPGKRGTFLIAPVNGGVWKTSDFGRTWQPIFDDQPTQSVGAIAVAPSNASVIYVGSGEGLRRPDQSVGNGVYRSRDGGATWTHVGLPDAQQIPKLAIDPRDADRVFAAVLGHPYGPSEQRGVFRSRDGGRTWQRVLFTDADTGASDVAIDPQHPDTIYAALWKSRLAPWEDDNEYEQPGGLYKSTDGGTTWKKLERGLPSNAAQFEIAIAPSRPSRIYVTVATTERGEYARGGSNGVFRSDDSGATWTRITTDERPALKIGGGDLMVPVVDPKDPDVVYVASIVAMRSRDGGKTWTHLRGAPGGDDYQNLWIDPDDSQTFVLASDQGAVVTSNGGATWSSWYNQPTAQLYHVGISADVPYRVCSGQQESGSACVASRSDDGTIGYRDWRPVAASEYGYAVPDPRDPDIVYGAGRSHVSRYRRSTGRVQNVTPIPLLGAHRVERTQPLVFSPVDPRVLFYAAEVLFETSDGGQTWQQRSGDLAHPHPGIPPSVGAMASGAHAGDQRGAIYAIAPSRKSINTIWIGTDDGKLWRTRDRGARWTDITPPALAPWSKVTQLDASHFDDDTAYASVSRLRVDDLAPYIYKTHDGGKTWSPIASNLPASPVNAVREDPIRKGLLYAATETGVWISFDDGARWQPLQQNLPRTSVRDLVVHDNDLVVATHGRGFWIMDDVALLRELAPAMTDTLFAPAPALRLPRSLYSDTPVPPDEPHADNPPTGAIVDYYLAAPVARVTLDIVDARGQLVRRFASDDAPELAAEQIAKQLIPPYWIAPPQRLATTAGMHRFVWDLRRAPPLAIGHDYPISAAPHATPRTPEGARVAPGTYTARLGIGGKTLSRAFEVRVDPRVKLAAGAVAELARVELQLSDAIAKASALALQARAIAAQLAAIASKDPAVADAIAAVAALAERPRDRAPGVEPPPTLAGVARAAIGLYEAIAIDAAPTAAQRAAIGKLERDLATVASKWDAVKSGPLAKVVAAGHPLRFDAKAPPGDGGDDD